MTCCCGRASARSTKEPPSTPCCAAIWRITQVGRIALSPCNGSSSKRRPQRDAAARPGPETNCMSGKSFVDTNVLISLCDQRTAAKQRRAASLLQQLAEEGDAPVFSTQVLQETFVGLTRKL